MRVMITGAAGGIGSACVLRLAAQNEVDIIAVSRSGQKLKDLREQCLQLYNKDIHIVVSDFTQSGFEQHLADIMLSEGGRLDCLINNAGVLVNKPFEELSGKEIEWQVDLNFIAPLKLIQAMLPYMIGNGAHVVSISSMGGFQGSAKFPGLSVYSATKSALSTLTECLAVEYADRGVAFNCLALGSARTEMLKQAFPDYESPMLPDTLAQFIVDFALKGHKYFNGKVLPVAGITT